MFVGELDQTSLSVLHLLCQAAIVYRKQKSKRNALIGMVVGTLVMAAVGILANYFVLLPFYSTLYGMPIDAFVKMGAAIFPFIKSVWGLLFVCVLPLI